MLEENIPAVSICTVENAIILSVPIKKMVLEVFVDYISTEYSPPQISLIYSIKTWGAYLI